MSTHPVQQQELIPAGTWTVDPVHSIIEFQVNDMTNLVASVRGRFADFEGTVEARDGEIGIEGVVRTASVSTDNEQRDAHLRSPDFLESETYPEMRFRSTQIEPRDDGGLHIVGELTIKETPFEIELDGRVLGHGQDQWGNERVALEGAGALEWGTTTVSVSVNASAVKAS
jgi:polyisoprenoid-binding protein YceI